MTNNERDRQTKKIGTQACKYTDSMTGSRKTVCNITQSNYLIYKDDFYIFVFLNQETQYVFY